MTAPLPLEVVTYDWQTCVVFLRFRALRWEFDRAGCSLEAEYLIGAKLRFEGGLFPGERGSYEVLETHAEWVDEHGGVHMEALRGYHPGRRAVQYLVGFTVRASPHDWGAGKYAPPECLVGASFRAIKPEPFRINPIR